MDVNKNQLKKINQELKKSEERYHNLINNISDIIGEASLEGEITYVSPQVHHMFGYQPEEMIGSNVNKYVHPDDFMIIAEAMKNAIHTGAITSVEYRFLHKKGHYVPISLNGQVITGDKEDFFIVIIRDNTEKKNDEKKIKESEKRYRDFLENLNDIAYETDELGNVTYCNKITEEFIGLSRDKIIGHTFLPFFSEDDGKVAIENYNKTLNGESPIFELTIINSGRICQFNNRPLKNDKGEIVGVFGIARDITERKKSEQKLKESEEKLRMLNIKLEQRIEERTKELKDSEEKYRYIFENTRFAIILINLDGIIIDCNPSTERITGYKKQELIGRNYRNISIIHEKYFNLINKLFSKLFDGEIVHRIDVEFMKKDGSLIWVNIQASVVNISEKKFLNVLIHDITERKMAESLVKEEVKKMKELDQIRKNLMIRISHELKTPLIPVCSGTELILDKHEEQLEGELGEIFKMIQRGGQRLKMLINRLLDLSRLEYDALLLEKHKSNLSEIIKECSSDMMHLIKNREIALNLDIRDSFYLEIDAMRIEQVITNILSNAIKNTPPKGKISISLVKDDNWAKISVADTGIGLTEEEMKKIFTRFGKIERHGKGLEYLDIKGSGLGLFISKEIVDLHGGSIWAESEGRNMGSTFTVKLPIL